MQVMWIVFRQFDGLGLAEAGEIRALQPNPCTKDKLKN